MQDLIEKAINASRESKQVEFKCGFDPTSNGEWCELIKDIVAIANSGGGIILFGVNDDGSLSGSPVDAVGKIDHADLSSKVAKYTGCVDPQIEIRDLERQGIRLPAFVIQPSANAPMVFGNPGTYDIGQGKQKTAFGRGTVYFRHGAKSEPGTTEDVRSAFERRLNQLRNSWLKQVKKVVSAPSGSQLVTHTTTEPLASIGSGTVRVVNNPKAIPVTLTRDPSKPGATYFHEEVSEGIFDEINNVVDANRVLAKGQTRFFLGPQVYYRVYSERHSIRQSTDQITMLFHAGSLEFYAPNLFWALGMDANIIARNITDVYLAPKGLQVRWLMRLVPLLGKDFCFWLYDKCHGKWHKYSQPPSFYFTFGEMIKGFGGHDSRLLAARSKPNDRISLPGQPEATCSELLGNPEKAEALLSEACIAIFEGNPQLRSVARSLDYIAHGSGIVRRAGEIADAAMARIGDQLPGDYSEPAAREQRIQSIANN